MYFHLTLKKFKDCVQSPTAFIHWLLVTINSYIMSLNFPELVKVWFLYNACDNSFRVHWDEDPPLMTLKIFIINIVDKEWSYWSCARRIEQGDDRISTVSFRKNRFCALLKWTSLIFILNIYVSDSIFSVDFTRAVSFCKQVVSSSFYPSWSCAILSKIEYVRKKLKPAYLLQRFNLIKVF